MRLQAQTSQLVLVDYQQKLMPAMHDGPAVLRQARLLAKLAQGLQIPIWGTEQRPDKLGSNDAELRQACRQTLEKYYFSAVPHSPLLEWLNPQAPQSPARPQIVLAGCEAHICLMQTGLDLLAAGWPLWVVQDACSSRAPAEREAGLARLVAAGAQRVTVEMLAFEWLAHSEHPMFREVQGWIK